MLLGSKETSGGTTVGTQVPRILTLCTGPGSRSCQGKDTGVGAESRLTVVELPSQTYGESRPTPCYHRGSGPDGLFGGPRGRVPTRVRKYKNYSRHPLYLLIKTLTNDVPQTYVIHEISTTTLPFLTSVEGSSLVGPTETQRVPVSRRSWEKRTKLHQDSETHPSGTGRNNHSTVNDCPSSGRLRSSTFLGSPNPVNSSVGRTLPEWVNQG